MSKLLALLFIFFPLEIFASEDDFYEVEAHHYIYNGMITNNFVSVLFKEHCPEKERKEKKHSDLKKLKAVLANYPLYPDKETKIKLANEFGLTLKQVDDCFANYRKRDIHASERGELQRKITEVQESVLHAWVNEHLDCPSPNEDNLEFLAQAIGKSEKYLRNWFHNLIQRGLEYSVKHIDPKEFLIDQTADTIKYKDLHCSSIAKLEERTAERIKERKIDRQRENKRRKIEQAMNPPVQHNNVHEYIPNHHQIVIIENPIQNEEEYIQIDFGNEMQIGPEPFQYEYPFADYFAGYPF